MTGVARQAEDALSRAERINSHLEAWRRWAGDHSATALRLVEQLARNPFWTVRGAADSLGVAFTTAQRAIDLLEHARIVKRRTLARRDRVYCAHAILDILEEPARLTPESPGREKTRRR